MKRNKISVSLTRFTYIEQNYGVAYVLNTAESLTICYSLNLKTLNATTIIGKLQIWLVNKIVLVNIFHRLCHKGIEKKTKRKKIRNKLTTEYETLTFRTVHKYKVCSR